MMILMVDCPIWMKIDNCGKYFGMWRLPNKFMYSCGICGKTFFLQNVNCFNKNILSRFSYKCKKRWLLTITMYVELAPMPQRIGMLVFCNKLLSFSKKWEKSGCYVFRSGAYRCYTYTTNETKETLCTIAWGSV